MERILWTRSLGGEHQTETLATQVQILAGPIDTCGNTRICLMCKCHRIIMGQTPGICMFDHFNLLSNISPF